MRERLPDVRKSVTHKLVLCHPKPSGKINRLHIYITVGLYADGRPAELFLTINGGTEMLCGWCKVWAIAISLCLQSGVKLDKLYEKMAYQDFEPKGFTENNEIKSCTSIADYVMQWMKKQFGELTT